MPDISSLDAPTPEPVPDAKEKSARRASAADALSHAEDLADALELQNQLRQQAEMEREEREAMAKELQVTQNHTTHTDAYKHKTENIITKYSFF